MAGMAARTATRRTTPEPSRGSLNFAGEAENCYPCHDGNVAAKNIESEFNKASIHPIVATAGIHDPTEDPVNPPRHVTCVDCHNSHAVKLAPATAPAASGALAGVWRALRGGQRCDSGRGGIRALLPLPCRQRRPRPGQGSAPVSADQRAPRVQPGERFVSSGRNDRQESGRAESDSTLHHRQRDPLHRLP